MLETVTIKDLGEITTGNTPPRSKPELYGKHTPFIKATDISESSKYTYCPEECYSEEGFQKYKSSLIPKGSTCVVTIGSVGKKLTMAHCDCFINQAMNSIIPNQNFDNEYVYYLLRHNVHKLKMLDSGTASGRENISKSAFSNMEIEVIQEKDKQIQIGSVLSKYDALIENNHKQIQLLEEVAQRLYKEWFVDLRFPGYADATIVDGVPEGWVKGTLGDIALFKRGKTITKAQVRKGEVAVVAGGLEPAYYHNSANTMAPVITVSGSGANAGFTRLYNVDVFASDCSFADSKTTSYLYFAYCFLKHNKASVDALRKGAAQPHVYAKDVNALELIIPSDNLLEVYTEYVFPYFETIKVLQRQIELSSEARDRLLPKLMKGELEV